MDCAEGAEIRPRNRGVRHSLAFRLHLGGNESQDLGCRGRLWLGGRSVSRSS
jgi:hypothetical protein